MNLPQCVSSPLGGSRSSTPHLLSTGRRRLFIKERFKASDLGGKSEQPGQGCIALAPNLGKEQELLKRRRDPRSPCLGSRRRFSPAAVMKTSSQTGSAKAKRDTSHRWRRSAVRARLLCGENKQKMYLRFGFAAGNIVSLMFSAAPSWPPPQPLSDLA